MEEQEVNVLLHIAICFENMGKFDYAIEFL